MNQKRCTYYSTNDNQFYEVGREVPVPIDVGLAVLSLDFDWGELVDPLGNVVPMSVLDGPSEKTEVYRLTDDEGGEGSAGRITYERLDRSQVWRTELRPNQAWTLRIVVATYEGRLHFIGLDLPVLLPYKPAWNNDALLGAIKSVLLPLGYGEAIYPEGYLILVVEHYLTSFEVSEAKGDENHDP